MLSGIIEKDEQRVSSQAFNIDYFFSRKVAKSERLRSNILIGLLAIEALILLVIYFFNTDEYLVMFKTHIAIYAIFSFTFFKYS